MQWCIWPGADGKRGPGAVDFSKNSPTILSLDVTLACWNATHDTARPFTSFHNTGHTKCELTSFTDARISGRERDWRESKCANAIPLVLQAAAVLWKCYTGESDLKAWTPGAEDNNVCITRLLGRHGRKSVPKSTGDTSTRQRQSATVLNFLATWHMSVVIVVIWQSRLPLGGTADVQIKVCWL